MSVICSGVTDKKKPCKQRCVTGLFCRFHKNQDKSSHNITEIKASETTTEIRPKLIHLEDSISSESLEDLNDDSSESVEYIKTTNANCTACSICLSDLSNEDCTLKCGHIYHTECIGKWIETASVNSNECPMCRKTIKFKEKAIVIDDDLKAQNLTARQNEMINEDMLFAGDLDAQENHMANDGYYDDHRIDDDIRRALEESLLTFENDDYDLLADVLEQSYHSLEAEEGRLIEDAIQANLIASVEKLESESIQDTIDRLMQGKECVTIKLK